MHVIERGSGKAHVWLHGFLGNGLNLTPLAKNLAGAHIFPDARNHGKSAHTPEMTIPAMAKDVLALLDSRSLKTATLIGHSMGGKVAMSAGSRWSDRFPQLVLLDIAPVDYNILLTERSDEIKFYVIITQMQQMLAISLAGKKREQVTKELMDRIRNKKVVDLLASNLSHEGESLKWRCGVENLARGYDNVAEWSQTEKPYLGRVLVLAGEHSRHTNMLPLHGKSLASLYTAMFPNVEIQVIQGAGHWVHVDKQEATREAIARFLGAS